MPALIILLASPVSPAQTTAGKEGPKAGAAVAAKKAAPAAKSGDTKGAKAAAAGDEGRISIGKIIEWGGYIGKFIILLSVVTVFLVLLNVFLLRRGRLCPKGVERKVRELLKAKRIRAASEYTLKQSSVLSRVICIGLTRRRGGYEEMEQVMADLADDEAMRLEQGIGYFSLLAAISPLCGLLGTVVGMIAAFNEIAVKGVVSPGELADPIQKALVTTCFGLVVAIPNVVAFTFFRNKLQRILAEISVVVEDLMTPFRGLKPSAPPIGIEAEAETEPEAEADAMPALIPTEAEPTATPTEAPEEEEPGPAEAEAAEAEPEGETEEVEGAAEEEAEAEADAEEGDAAEEAEAEPEGEAEESKADEAEAEEDESQAAEAEDSEAGEVEPEVEEPEPESEGAAEEEGGEADKAGAEGEEGAAEEEPETPDKSARDAGPKDGSGS